MSQVVSFTGYTPPARYDTVAWTLARVEEALSEDGTWTQIDELALSPVDTNPATPRERNLTTENASDTPALWYRVIFADAGGNVSQPTAAIQNVTPPETGSLYVEVDELKASLALLGTDFADADVRRATAAASRGLDGLCRRRFWLDPVAVDRYYTCDSEIVQIDDLPLVTGDPPPTVSLAGTDLVSGTDYLLEPLNAPADDRPYEQLRLLTTVDRTPAALKVTGRFGWEAVPSDINAAATILGVKLVIRMRRAPLGFATLGVDAVTAIRIASGDPDVTWLIDRFVRTRALKTLQLS